MKGVCVCVGGGGVRGGGRVCGSGGDLGGVRDSGEAAKGAGPPATSQPPPSPRPTHQRGGTHLGKVGVREAAVVLRHQQRKPVRAGPARARRRNLAARLDKRLQNGGDRTTHGEPHALGGVGGGQLARGAALLGGGRRHKRGRHAAAGGAARARQRRRQQAASRRRRGESHFSELHCGPQPSARRFVVWSTKSFAAVAVGVPKGGEAVASNCLRRSAATLSGTAARTQVSAPSPARRRVVASQRRRTTTSQCTPHASASEVSSIARGRGRMRCAPSAQFIMRVKRNACEFVYSSVAAAFPRFPTISVR